MCLDFGARPEAPRAVRSGPVWEGQLFGDPQKDSQLKEAAWFSGLGTGGTTIGLLVSSFATESICEWQTLENRYSETKQAVCLFEFLVVGRIIIIQDKKRKALPS